MTTPNARKSSRVAERRAEDRYFRILILSALLVVALAITALLFYGQSRRQRALMLDQQQVIQQLAQRIDAAERRALATATRPADPPALPTTRPVAPASAPATLPVSTQPASAAATAPSRSEADVVRSLDRLLRPGAELPFELVDRDGAERLLEEIRGDAQQSRWSGATLARISVLARLLGRDGPAEWFAIRAAAAGVEPAQYHEIAVRQLLSAGRSAEASIAARRLLESGSTRPTDIALLAVSLALRGDVAGADEWLARLKPGDIRGLNPRDRAALAQALALVEDWDGLEATLTLLADEPEAQKPPLPLLRAVLAIQRRRLPEALGMLDQLLAQSPGDYDVQTWRGVALLEARQFAAARAALAHAERFPDRPEAWHWMGVVELRDGKPHSARPLLERSIAAAQRYAPAWEALGALELTLADSAAPGEATDAQLAAAVAALSRALEANPRRSSAHFLLAVAYARQGRMDESGRSLDTAILLDQIWADAARKTPLLEAIAPPPE